MADENATTKEQSAPNEENVTEEKPTNTSGESGNDAGADSSAGNSASGQGASYDMFMEMLSEVQANQARMSAQIQKLTDAQSVLVDAGAVIREGSDNTSSDVTDDNYDGFVSIDELDLNI